MFRSPIRVIPLCPITDILQLCKYHKHVLQSWAWDHERHITTYDLLRQRRRSVILVCIPHEITVKYNYLHRPLYLGDKMLNCQLSFQQSNTQDAPLVLSYVRRAAYTQLINKIQLFCSNCLHMEYQIGSMTKQIYLLSHYCESYFNTTF